MAINKARWSSLVSDGVGVGSAGRLLEGGLGVVFIFFRADGSSWLGAARREGVSWRVEEDGDAAGDLVMVDVAVV